MNSLYDFINLYISSFSDSFKDFTILSMFYIPIHIVFISFICNHFRLKKLTLIVDELAKPLFCAIMQSSALIFIIYVLFISYRIDIFLELLPKLLQCFMIIILAMIYAQINSKKNSWLFGVFLFIASIPTIPAVLKGLAIGIIPDIYTFYIFKDVISNKFMLFFVLFLFAFIPMFFLTIIQMISMRKIARSYNDQRRLNYNSFFLALLFSNFISVYLIKLILLNVYKNFNPILYKSITGINAIK